MSLDKQQKTTQMHSKGENMNSEMKKETYEEAKIEIIVFECEDIIQTSGGSSDGGAVILPGDSFW